MIRYGIVGFGAHAVKRLMPGFEKAANSKVTALSRRDQVKAREMSDRYGISHVFATTEELCRCPDVDAVFITSPNAIHFEDVMTAVRYRKPILCEKPMAMNAHEAKQMVEAARNAGVLLGIAQCFRFEDSVNRLRARVRAGDIGRPVFARSEFSFAGINHGRAWLTNAALAGGGPIADVGVHCIDALRYIFGDDPVRVTALTTRDAQAGEVESAASIVLEFKSGMLANVMVSYRAPYRTSMELVGTDGTLRGDDVLTVDRPVELEFVQASKVVDCEQVSNDWTYARQVDAFSDALESGKEFEIPGEEGWKNQVILDAAYRSARERRAVETGL